MVNPIRPDQLLAIVPDDGGGIQFAIPLETALLPLFVDEQSLDYLECVARLLSFTTDDDVSHVHVVKFNRTRTDS